MADRDSIAEYLAGASWRRVRPNDPHYRIVCRLIEEGRAEWCGKDRARLTGQGLGLQLSRATRRVEKLRGQ